jgi:hypothetical protein
MMGGVYPETCWAAYKYEIIKFWYIVAACWIFLWIVLWRTDSQTSTYDIGWFVSGCYVNVGCLCTHFLSNNSTKKSIKFRDPEMSEVSEKKDTSMTHGFKATAEMASCHVTCDCPYTHSAQAYQHIHPTIELHSTHS